MLLRKLNLTDLFTGICSSTLEWSLGLEAGGGSRFTGARRGPSVSEGPWSLGLDARGGSRFIGARRGASASEGSWSLGCSTYYAC